MAESQKTIDETMMGRALELAARAKGYTSTNPMVGCVITRNNQIIGEGWHKGTGFDPVQGRHHAEVNALEDAKAKGADIKGATAYVTLEPCNHTGATPPCAKALYDCGIKRVVYAMADPNKLAAGGADSLRSQGVRAEQGPLLSQAKLLNKAWLHRIKTGAPFVTAKFAASLDGKIATACGDSKWITGPAARRRAHELRHACDAILVGAGTIIADNPSLTVRDIENPSNPLRIVLDSKARTNPLAKTFSTEQSGGSLLVTTAGGDPNRLKAFTQQGIETLILPTDETGRINLDALLKNLGERGLNHLMVEGGSEILGSFFDGNHVNEVWGFIAPVLIGGAGKTPISGQGAQSMQDALRLKHIHTELCDQDILMRAFIPGDFINDLLGIDEEADQCLQVS